jgi:hypothetical protein
MTTYRHLSAQHKSTQSDVRANRNLPFIEPMNGRSVMVGFCVSRVGETLFEDRYPADNHDKYATNQSCKEQDFDKADRQNHQ